MSKTKLLVCCWVVCLSTFFLSQPAFALESNDYKLKIFSTDLKRDPDRPRAIFWPQLLSFFLPGFDQWFEAQFQQAIFYTSLSAVGTGIVLVTTPSIPDDGTDPNDPSGRNDYARGAILGNQIYMAAGSFSAYSSFRSAVKSRKASGDFDFLPEEETVDDLLVAPFHFQYLERPTTYWPVLIALSTAVAEIAGNGNAFANNSFRGADIGYASGFSYLAGTNEEALFRGWIMPVLMEEWDSPFWSNFATTTMFALAHLSSENQLPLPQFVLGGYLGYLTQRNHWTISESVFIHAWWDALVFTGTYLYNSRTDIKTTSMVYLPILSLTY